jgi:hypothetical protein
VAILCAGPLLIFTISTIAIDGTFCLYQRFLEAITIRAKIEQELGLTKMRSDNADSSNSYWWLEPIIPLRHIESRKGCDSSDAFINEYSTKGYHLWTVRLFRAFPVVKRFDVCRVVIHDNLDGSVNGVDLHRLTRCMRFLTLTQIAPLRSTTSHTPKPLCEIVLHIGSYR